MIIGRVDLLYNKIASFNVQIIEVQRSVHKLQSGLALHHHLRIPLESGVVSQATKLSWSLVHVSIARTVIYAI